MSVITVHIGYRTDGRLKLWDKGSYIIDETEFSGPPDKVLVRARSANYRESFTELRNKSWHNKKLGDIISSIANAHKLEAAVAQRFQSITIDHVDQTNESDGHFLVRLADRYGAMMNIKSNRLLFMSIGGGTTLSGAALPSIDIAKSDCSNYRFSAIDRDSGYTGVKAKWHDTTNGETYYELIGDKGRVRRLRPTHPSQAEANSAARSEWSRIQRGKSSMSLTLVSDMPGILTETPVSLAGWANRKLIRLAG